VTAVLLDLNIVLDVFLARSSWLADSAAVVKANHEGKIEAFLSAASVPTIFYLVRRNADLAKAKTVVAECLASFQIVPVDRATLQLAHSLSGSDFEDNLQVASAALARLDAIITRVPKGFAGSVIPALTPAELLAQLPKGDDV
jgi:hypothetical protein